MNLNNDVSAEEARALHRVVRAMHDGNCPKCGVVVDSLSMRSYKESGWKCPFCSFTISEEEATAAMAAFRPYMIANLEVFEKWRQRRIDAGLVIIPSSPEKVEAKPYLISAHAFRPRPGQPDLCGHAIGFAASPVEGSDCNLYCPYSKEEHERSVSDVDYDQSKKGPPVDETNLKRLLDGRDNKITDHAFRPHGDGSDNDTLCCYRYPVEDGQTCLGYNYCNKPLDDHDREVPHHHNKLDGLDFESLTPEVRAIWDSESVTARHNIVSGLRHYGHKITDLTCVTCPILAKCPEYRFDLYNTDGDCLAEK